MKTDLTKQRDSLARIWYEICSKLTLQEDILIHKKYMLFAGWEGRIVENCDRGLENVARGRRPRAAFSRPKSQFFTIRTDLSR